MAFLELGQNNNDYVIVDSDKQQYCVTNKCLINTVTLLNSGSVDDIMEKMFNQKRLGVPVSREGLFLNLYMIVLIPIFMGVLSMICVWTGKWNLSKPQKG